MVGLIFILAGLLSCDHQISSLVQSIWCFFVAASNPRNPYQRSTYNRLIYVHPHAKKLQVKRIVLVEGEIWSATTCVRLDLSCCQSCARHYASAAVHETFSQHPYLRATWSSTAGRLLQPNQSWWPVFLFKGTSSWVVRKERSDQELSLVFF